MHRQTETMRFIKRAVLGGQLMITKTSEIIQIALVLYKKQENTIQVLSTDAFIAQMNVTLAETFFSLDKLVFGFIHPRIRALILLTPPK